MALERKAFCSLIVHPEDAGADHGDAEHGEAGAQLMPAFLLPPPGEGRDGGTHPCEDQSTSTRARSNARVSAARA